MWAFWALLIVVVIVAYLLWSRLGNSVGPAATAKLGSLSSPSDVTAVFFVWDSEEKSGAEWLLPDGFNMNFGAGSSNMGLGSYDGFGVALIYMENMQAQYNLAALITNLRTLPATFSNLKYLVGSGTCASFAQSPGDDTFGYPPDVAIGTQWVNGFTQGLYASSGFSGDVASGVSALNNTPVSPGGSVSGGSCIDQNTSPSIVVGTVLSAGGDVYPGTVTNGSPWCQIIGSAGSCLSSNETFLNANNSGVSGLLQSLGLSWSSDSPSFQILETDDYYVSAITQKFMPSLDVLTSRGVINTYYCTGTGNTYKEYAAASAILTGARILSDIKSNLSLK